MGDGEAMSAVLEYEEHIDVPSLTALLDLMTLLRILMDQVSGVLSRLMGTTARRTLEVGRYVGALLVNQSSGLTVVATKTTKSRSYAVTEHHSVIVGGSQSSLGGSSR